MLFHAYIYKGSPSYKEDPNNQHLRTMTQKIIRNIVKRWSPILPLLPQCVFVDYSPIMNNMANAAVMTRSRIAIRKTEADFFLTLDVIGNSMLCPCLDIVRTINETSQIGSF